ncbi:MAG: hypothetical protein KKF58_00185 [Gammaproteobacteria bacterium]|nr:hypothetical protein [Gammaproteobacteria bacterium]MBU1446703.1 hypothetical protein [Gammaproteobacteria bacterium]
MSESSARPIGGYFELELPKSGKFPYPDAFKYQSARAAFLALLRARKPKRVWLPKYICDAMLMPLQTAKIECIWYELDSKLAVSGEVQLGAGDLLVYVNYFGLHNKNVGDLLKRFPPQQIVLDYSQSFFEPPAEAALATLYSPRKFFGVPDGGLLVSKLAGTPISKQDAGSLGRSAHLLKRLAGSPEDGYADYQHAEEGLSDSEPKRMSKLTERILGAVDFDGARNARHENFMYLHRELGSINPFEIDVAAAAAPLCYPFMTNDPTLRQRMIANRIFVPTYWADALARVGDKWANRMVKNLLPLPVDQRYDRKDMQRIVAIIQERNI